MNNKIYSPIVKGKLNDLKALGKLSTSTRNIIKPMIEVMPIAGLTSMDNHLFKIADYLVKHVPLGDIYLDFYGIKLGAKTINEEPAITAGYKLVKSMGRSVTPTYGFHRDDFIWPDLANICKLFKEGFCFRIDIDDIEDSYISEDTWSQIIERSSQIQLNPSEIDLMIDLRDVRNENLDDIHEKVIDFLAINSSHNRYRTIIIAGSSAMKTLSEKPEIPKDNIGSVDRNELLIWGNLLKDVPESTTLVFGDYGVIHPDFSDQSANGFKYTNAKIRYTRGNKIDYYRGHGLRHPLTDYEQYYELANKVITSKGYSGKEFSFGDNYISHVADRNILPKQTAPWVLADMNHHIEYTTIQIQELFEAMITRDDIPELIEASA